MPPNEPEARTLVAEHSEDGEQFETTIVSGGQSHKGDPFPSLRRGDTLGRYVVLEMLGHGGMGVVYSAYDPELDRRVAIKLLKLGWDARPRRGGRARLLREAQALARLTHPHVVGVYDVGTWQESVFVAMEFIEGETIARWIARKHEHEPPSWREVLDVMLPAGRGLAAAHAAGILHRDFKPENVMLSAAGRVVVLDFGLAKGFEAGPDSQVSAGVEVSTPSSGAILERLTVTGCMVGTPAYMSPEQLGMGLSTEASDQFSYCVSLYHALYGVRPFAGDTVMALSESVFSGRVEPAPRSARVPAWLRRVVVRGLAIEAHERYPSMNALMHALTRDPTQRRRRILVGVGVLGVLGGVGVLARQVASRQDPCVQVDDAMNDAWGPTQRDALERAFRRDARNYSESSIDRVEHALEDYAQRWIELRRAACEAGREVGTATAREARLSAACLDGRLRRFDAIVRLFGDADQAMVAKAMSAVQMLPDLGECRDGERYRRSHPMPEDLAQQEQVESIRLRNADLRALTMTGRAREAEGLIEALLVEARALGFQPLIAEVAYAQGMNMTELGQYERALPVLEQALLVARAHSLEQLEAKLLTPLVFLHTSFTSEYVLAEWYARVQEVLVEQLDRGPARMGQVLVRRGDLAFHRDRVHESIELIERGIELQQRGHSSAMSMVLAYSKLANAYMELDRYDDAIRVLGQAEELAATELGPEHPIAGNLLTQLARVESDRNNYADSVRRLRAALRIIEGAYGDRHPNVSAVLNGLGMQLDSLGESDDAIATYRRALDIVVEVFGPRHEQVAQIEANLGNTLRRGGQAEEALRLHRHAHDLRERLELSLPERYFILDNVGDDLRVLGRCEEAEVEYRAANALREQEGRLLESGASYAMLGIGLCQWQRGERPAAHRTLEQALTQALREHEVTGYEEALALVRFSLAMVLRELGIEAPRVRVLTERARAFWEARPVEFEVLLEQLRAWEAGGPMVMPTY
ncbi:MAG: serine/threonine-protein kinase [Myxococcota bacterium]